MESVSRRATVSLLIDQNGKVCLARKKKAIHREGEEISYSLGMWNGYGGKMDVGDEDILDTAVRELIEEAGVVADKKDFNFVSRVYFYDKKMNEMFMDVSFFLVKKWTENPKETKEMGPPVFFDQKDIPYPEMMPADRIIFEKILGGSKYFAKIIFAGKNAPPEIFELDGEL